MLKTCQKTCKFETRFKSDKSNNTAQITFARTLVRIVAAVTNLGHVTP